MKRVKATKEIGNNIISSLKYSKKTLPQIIQIFTNFIANKKKLVTIRVICG
jgi:hypothetical protein